MNERKRNVVNTAQRLFIERGFQNTSIQDILDEAKISKGTFYNYFNSKRECLIAMIDHGIEEVKIRRRKLLASREGYEVNSIDFLVEQMAIPWQVNRDEKLAPIYEAVFQSSDDELKQVVSRNYLSEVEWLARRIADIYGKAARPYSYDCAVLIHGMQKQMITAWRLFKKEPVEIKEILRYVLKRADVIIEQLIEQDDRFIGEYAKLQFAKAPESKQVTEAQMAKQLEVLMKQIAKDELQEGKEYTELLLKEFQSERPKKYVIEAIVVPFAKVFNQTAYEKAANELTNMIWSYLEENKK